MISVEVLLSRRRPDHRCQVEHSPRSCRVRDTVGEVRAPPGPARASRRGEAPAVRRCRRRRAERRIRYNNRLALCAGRILRAAVKRAGAGILLPPPTVPYPDLGHHAPPRCAPAPCTTQAASAVSSRVLARGEPHRSASQVHPLARRVALEQPPLSLRAPRRSRGLDAHRRSPDASRKLARPAQQRIGLARRSTGAGPQLGVARARPVACSSGVIAPAHRAHIDAIQRLVNPWRKSCKWFDTAAPSTRRRFASRFRAALARSPRERSGLTGIARVAAVVNQSSQSR